MISGLGYRHYKMRPPQKAADRVELLPSGTCVGKGGCQPLGKRAALPEGLIHSKLFKREENVY